MSTHTFDPAIAHHHFASDCFNKAWELMRKPDRTIAENRMMLTLTHASIYHWSQRTDCTPKNMAIGYWQASRVYALLNDALHARAYAEVCLGFSGEVEPFYCGYAYEALARADALAGNKEGAATYITAARKCLEEVTDPTERKMLEADLATIA
jgi:hypothetical protein